MRNGKRWLCLLLAGCMLGAAGCGKESNTDPQTNGESESANQSAESAAEKQTETRQPLGLEKKDFGGAKYRISYESQGILQLYTEEGTGDAVNDAIYDRNALLMDEYNMEFAPDHTADDYQVHAADIARSIKSGEDAWELVLGHVVQTNNLAVQGFDRNLYDVPNLQFDKPWWPGQSVDEMTVYGRMFTICGSYSPAQLSAGKIIYFNKDLLDEANVEYPYREVKDGTWTMDRLIERSAAFGWNDQNGDNERGIEDVYGFIAQPIQNGFLISTQTPVLGKTEDGGREITVLSEKTSALVEKLYRWYFESGSVFCGNREDGTPDNYKTMFRDGHGAYAFANVDTAVQMFRESDVRYGIVPMPKWDEAQDTYYVFACPNLVSIPISCKNLDFSGYILEAMTYYGYYMIIPVYYEKTLKGRIADQPEDAEMLEIINDHLTVSFAYCYDNWEGFAHLMGCLNFNTKPSTDLASMYKSRYKKAEKRLNDVLKAFREYGEAE